MSPETKKAITILLIVFLGAIFSLLFSAANGNAGLSIRMEKQVARYLPKGISRLYIRYMALFVIGLFASAYTFFVIKPVNEQAAFAGSLAATIALESFPLGIKIRKNDDDDKEENHENKH